MHLRQPICFYSVCCNCVLVGTRMLLIWMDIATAGGGRCEGVTPLPPNTTDTIQVNSRKVLHGGKIR